MVSQGPSSDIEAFRTLLKGSKRVLAWLSASSGLSTFRGAGGMWRNHDATVLATPEAFEEDPGLVWLFYSYRRHKALQAEPNPAHYALTELARRMPGFWCLSQNVDGLSTRAAHPSAQLKLLHGSLFDIKCFNERCGYIERDNFNDPVHPSLAITSEEDPRMDAAGTANETSDSSAGAQTGRTSKKSSKDQTIPTSQLPHCPSCRTGLLRPGVVWFGEALPVNTISEISNFIAQGPIDLIMVIGTTATVYPAAGYVDVARRKGAKVAVFNVDGADLGSATGLGQGDFLFVGDAAETLPSALKEMK
ncbi:DHS-like NAD protein [Coleophoma cylindrospora]|uniref:DHS-like NAD protein n=1 Tax=Coleophoma cylindrospora TaxID=1849047 RepID=A0A3D8RMJ8_9HELO|nr:DHS-like NAD protein [Coleophoma cylindrospora]